MLNGLNTDNDEKLIKYTNVEYGSNVKFREVNGVKIIDVPRMRHSCVMIATPKNDCVSFYRDKIYVINTDIEDKSSNRKGSDHHLSGIILLAFAIQKEAKDENVLKSKLMWERLVREMASYSKPNIMDSPNLSHYGTEGWYYSFGNRALFRKIENTSVGQYCNKKQDDEQKQDEINNIASELENIIAVEIRGALDSFSSIIPNIKMLMSPILDIAYDLQDEYGDINLKTTLQGSGSWASNLCVNATTNTFHNEMDCTYTLISVPRQKKSMIRIHFSFC